MIRVLHVSHTWNEGGSGLYAAALAGAQARLGAEVRRFGPGLARGLGLRDEATERAFADALPADVVHIHHLSGMSFRLPRIAHDAGARVVLTLHDAWLWCARGQLVDLDLARCPGPSTERCARCLAPDLWGGLPGARRLPLRVAPVRAREAALADALGAIDRILAPSAAFARRLGVAAAVLPLPLLRPVPAAPPAPPGPIRFLFLGSLIPTKGPQIVLDAFAGLPAGAGTLRIVGPAPRWRGSDRFAAALRRRAAELPGVTIEGAEPQANVPLLLAESDVLLFPSQWEENAPLVVQEARAAGLRIVASDVDAIREQAPEAVRVEPGEVEAWRRAMAAEVRAGRRRNAPVPGGDMDEHARRVLEFYRG